MYIVRNECYIKCQSAPAAPTVNLTQPACGSATGTITVTAPTGTGMTYSINGSTYTNTSGIFTAVAVGTYNVTARNAAGCTSPGTSVTLNANPAAGSPDSQSDAAGMRISNRNYYCHCSNRNRNDLQHQRLNLYQYIGDLYRSCRWYL